MRVVSLAALKILAGEAYVAGRWSIVGGRFVVKGLDATFVLDVYYEARRAVHIVVDSLFPTIREHDPIVSLGVVIIAGLVMTVIVVIAVFNRPIELVLRLMVL